MKVLVLGRQGQLARSLVEAARETPTDLVALGRPDVDILEPDSIEASLSRHQPDIVINTAGYTDVEGAEHEVERALATNRDGAGHVADLCRRNALPLIHVSTDFVFDGAEAAPYRETDASTPLNRYGLSKLAGERQVAGILPEHLIVRTAWLHSPFGRNFATSIVEQARAGRPIRVVGDQWGCPTYAPHLAALLLTLAGAARRERSQAAVWGTYHAAGAGGTSRYEQARAILDCLIRSGLLAPELTRVSSDELPSNVARPRDSRLDCAKLERVFGLTLPGWQCGIEACVTRLLARDTALASGREFDS